MEIKPLELPPKDLEGVLTQTQLEEFPERDRPVLLAVSKLEQLMRWHIGQMSDAINQARRAEASLIRKANFAKRAILATLTITVTAIITVIVDNFPAIIHTIVK